MAVSALLVLAQLCKGTALRVGGHFQSAARVPLSTVRNDEGQLTVFDTSPLVMSSYYCFYKSKFLHAPGRSHTQTGHVPPRSSILFILSSWFQTLSL